MEDLFVPLVMMVVVFSLIPLYFWRRRLDSRVHQHEEEHQNIQGERVVRATNARRMRRRPAASSAASTSSAAADVEETLDGSDEEEAADGYYAAKASKKKERRRQEREAQRQADEAARDSRKTKQDRYEEMRRRKDEEREAQERKLEEEAKARKAKEEEAAALEVEKWKGEFSIDAEGTTENEVQDGSQGLLFDFVEYIKKHKCVPLEDIATEFKLRTQDCINRITSLESMGRLSGVMDDRGKYIYISLEEMKAVADYIKREGRVSISHLASKSNQFIDLEPKAQHRELLVSAEGAVVVDGDGDFPFRVGNNGTVLAGYPQADLKTAIDTAADFTQMQVQINLKGSQFGVSAKQTPMPKTIKIVNAGYKCPAITRKGGYMHTCCKKDPKHKEKIIKTKFYPRHMVTIDNNHPLGRLDQWNLTWEWMRNEFINNMRGAYTHKKDPSECIYGPQGQYYRDFDFSTVMSCQKKPIIADLPPEKEMDDKIGRLPYCCKNGILLPKTMNETKSKAMFQLEVFKLPPDMNRTALNPPQNWKIVGRLNPTYKCGPPVRVDPTEFPDPSGIDATISAIASWQVTCNMTSPKPQQAKCCVSYSAYYADGVVPCNTCACGCENQERCDKNASPLLLPSDALLVPFANRSQKALAFARLKHNTIPKKLPCPDNCGVSINWHIDSDYKSGWTARMTLQLGRISLS
ncbi:UNVERIFIED_CONTAM: COBRA-like protein 10 [Sesamum radiatum]|uniref:DDRGK domain-containing protein 1 n=1 Tax=Sesamum radiatum TaxID=300843 RepID=A0AAW2KHS4_SESRA